MRLRRNNSGMIIYVVLWTMVILSAMAIGIGRRTNMDLTLTKHSIGKVRAKYFSWAGLMYALDLVRQDPGDLISYASACDVNMFPEESSLSKKLGEGTFAIGNEDHPGILDEERLLNLNALKPDNVNVFEALMVLLGFDEDEARIVAASILDWTDYDGDLSEDSYGAEDGYYTGLAEPYHCKNRPLDSKEEVMLVRGMTKERYDLIKDYVTVYPKYGSLKINFTTAPEIILRSLARAKSGHASNTQIVDADSLTDKLIQYRNGDDGVACTQDDRKIEPFELALNAKESAVLRSMEIYRTDRSNYLRIVSMGTDASWGISSQIEAVIQRNTLGILYSHRN